MVDQLDAENRLANSLTPDPHGHLRPAREAVALIQQALSGTRQNPTVVESSPTPMSGSRRFPSLVEESPALGAYPDPPSGSRLNLTIIEESLTQIKEDECDQWVPLAVEQGNDDEEEEIGVLERHELHHSPISVASSPAPPEPMSGTRDRPMLVEESPAPHYITVEDSPAPQFIAVEESPVPMSGVKTRLCLVVESPERTEDRAGTTSPVPMSGTKDRPSLVDDSPAMPEVNNPSWGGGNLAEGRSATLPKNLVSPPTNTSPTEDPQLPNWGGGVQRFGRDRSLFLTPIREPNHLWWLMSHHSILWWTRPHPHRSGRILLVLFPLCRHSAAARWLTSSTCKESHTWFGHQIVGVQGGDIPLVGGRQHLLLRGSHHRLALRGGPLVPLWQGGAAGGGGGGSSPPRGRGCPSVRHSGGPTPTRGEEDLQHTCGCPRRVVHYETCIQSLMAQVKDLRTQNLGLQRSHQELYQAVASTVGISQSYGDRMTQILSTLAKFDAAVQGYRRDSKVVENSVADHHKMSNGNTAECFSAVESLATRYAAVASRIDAWDHWYSTPAEPVTVVLPPPSAPPLFPDPTPAAPTAPMGARSGSSGGGCVLPFSDHPSHDCIYHPNACPDSGWPRGGEEHHEHPHPQEPTSWRGIAEKQKEPAVPEWRATAKGEEHPTEPTAPWAKEEENTSSLGNINPLTKNVFTSPWKLSYTPSHPTDTCTVSTVKVAPSASGGAPPTMAPPAYHPYQMPMVQNSYTKAVEDSDMPKPQFNGQLECYDEWVEKLQQWLGGCDPMYRKANEAKMILSTLPPWLKAIINAQVAEATHHTRTAPTLKELWDFLEHCFHEYDPSRADERWRALTPRVVKGQVTLIDLEDFYARWQRLLPLSNETRLHVIWEQLLSKLPWIKEKVVKQEAKNSPDRYVVDFGGLDPSPGRAPFEKELSKYSAQACTTVPEIVSSSKPGVIVDCKDPALEEWILKLNNTPHTHGYTMKVEQRRPILKSAEIYALANKSVSEREALERLNKGDRTTVTYTPRPSHNKTAVNAVNAEAKAEPNTSEPADTSVNAVGHPKPPAKKPVDLGAKLQPTFWVPCSKHWKTRKQTEMDMSWIDWGATNTTLWTCKPNSPCNDSHWNIAGKSEGGKPKGGDKGDGGDKGGGGFKGGGSKGDKGGKGAPNGRGRW